MTNLDDLYGFLIGKTFTYAKTMCVSIIIRVLIKDGEPVIVDTTYKDNRLNVEIDKDNYITRIIGIG